MHTNETGKQRLLCYWVYCLTAIICLAVVVVLLIIFAPELLKRNEEAYFRSQVANIKAANTSSVIIHKPELIDYILQDDECKEKIDTMLMTGDFIPDISDKRFQSLKQFSNLKTLELSYLGNVDAFLEGIQGMSSLEELVFHRAGVSEKGMRYILGFPNIKRLSFDDRTDIKCLNALKGHAGIESLGLYEYQTSVDRLAVIKSLPNLHKLSLELELEGDGVLNLEGLPMLEELSLGDSLATDVALANVEEMKNLTILNCEGHHLTDIGLDHVRNNLKLKRLCLRWQPITDDGLSHLSKLIGLEDLNLCKTKITDAGLQYIKGMTSLKKLSLYLTQVTNKAIKDLQQALPNCKIEWEPLKKD